MDQSLAVAVDLYSSMHFGMRKLYDGLGLAPLWKNAIYYGGTAAGVLAFAYLLPFGYPWMQQEFTRSILSRVDIKSLNGTYDVFNPMAVSGVTDAQLERFKAENPQNIIRMDEAGSEGYILFSNRMSRNVFFYDLHNLSNWTALIAVLIGGIGHNAAGVVAEYTGANSIDNDIRTWYKNDGGKKPECFMVLVVLTGYMICFVPMNHILPAECTHPATVLPGILPGNSLPMMNGNIW
jgi:hypothetical protein